MAAAAAARRYFIQCIVETWECLSPLRGSKRREGYLDYELIEGTKQTEMKFLKMCYGKEKTRSSSSVKISVAEEHAVMRPLELFPMFHGGCAATVPHKSQRPSQRVMH